MRDITIFFMAFCLLLAGFECSNPTNSDNDNSLIGTWYISKVVGTFFGEEESWEYDPGFDNYFSASILEITKTEFIAHYNHSGPGYYSETNNYEINKDMLNLVAEEEMDTLFYSFENGTLVLQGGLVTSEGNESLKYYLEKYEGPMPPESWTSALQNDNYEPDNDYQNANSLNVGGNGQKHTITAGDEDWFKFQASSGETYLIMISGYMDNVLTLFSTDGESEIAEDDDNDWDINVAGNVESVLVWDCDTSGTYYFKVIAFYDEEGEGYYEASVALTNMESPLFKPVVNNKRSDKKIRQLRMLNLKK